MELFSNLQEAFGGTSGVLRRRLSVALGHAWKDLFSNFDVVAFDAYEDRNEGDVRDYGALIRVAVLDRVGEDGAGSRIEIAAGYSRQNYDEERSGEIYPAADLTQYGASVRLTWARPTTGTGWRRNLFSPSIALGLAWTTTDWDLGDSETRPTANRFGAELSLWDVLRLRGGFVDDDFGDVHSPSWGVGISIQYRKVIGARFDWANYPQQEFLDDNLDRFGISVSLDPIRLWHEAR